MSSILTSQSSTSPRLSQFPCFHSASAACWSPVPSCHMSRPEQGDKQALLNATKFQHTSARTLQPPDPESALHPCWKRGYRPHFGHISDKRHGAGCQPRLSPCWADKMWQRDRKRCPDTTLDNKKHDCTGWPTAAEYFSSDDQQKISQRFSPLLFWPHFPGRATKHLRMPQLANPVQL